MNGEIPRPALDPTFLRNVVRRALNSTAAEVVAWDAEPITKAFSPITGGLIRLTGTARDGQETRPWSMVLKVAVDPPGNNPRYSRPGESNYWKREALLFQAGVLDGFPPGLAAPRCYGVSERSPDRVELFLENIVDDGIEDWPIERYALAARHIGRFNGAYLAGRPLPDQSCVSRGFLRSFVSWAPPLYERQSALADHPLLRGVWPPALLERQAALNRDREAFFTAVERLPQTFCHLDTWRWNLMSRRRDDGELETVAVDWAFAGIGAVGEDLVPLVGWEQVRGLRPPEWLPRLDAVAFLAYVDGLRDAGWHGDERLVRLGFTAAIAQRYGNIPYWAYAADEVMPGRLERAFKVPFPDVLRRVAGFVPYLLDWGDEARRLMRELGLG